MIYQHYLSFPMVKALVHVVVVAVALLIIANVVPGIAVAGLYTALIVSLVWGLFGLTLRPLLTLLTLPINLLTLGLFSFIVNALLFWFISSFIEGFTVAGFVPALIGSVILAVVSWVLHKVL